jgi:hypothetical protein
MNEKIKAFPTPARVNPDQFDTGMDLRDYFAIHCPEQISSLCWNDVVKCLKLPKDTSMDDWTPEITRLCYAKKRYEFADAMLKARELK